MYERYKVIKWKIIRIGKDFTNEIWLGWFECFRVWILLIICINILCVFFFLYVGLYCLNVLVVFGCGGFEILC